jgi:hypothetical protein
VRYTKPVARFDLMRRVALAIARVPSARSALELCDNASELTEFYSSCDIVRQPLGRQEKMTIFAICLQNDCKREENGDACIARAPSCLLLSALGHLRPSHSAPVPINVRYAPNSDQITNKPRMTLSARSGLMHRSKLHSYSITSSAVNRNLVGMSRPSAFTVLRLMISSNLVDKMTGKSAGLSPLRIRPA